MSVLNHDAQLPLYAQLYRQIKERILTGKLTANSRLPSVRGLAAELSTSRNTVESSYLELFAEGYLYSKPRSGYFVSALDHDAGPAACADRPPGPSLPKAPLRYRYDFHPARLDPKSFPMTLWRRCFLDSLRESAIELAHYGDPQGDSGLRSQIRSYLERSRGVLCEQEQIVVCSGLQQSLDIVARLLKDAHSVLAVESPGYFLPRSVFRNQSFEVAPIPVGAQGLDLDALKRSHATMAYVTPSHQFPLGCVMPVANRLKLIEWAESGAKFILEDDYDSELRYHGKPIPSLQGLRPGGNIIYLGSFSKILSPALRISYLVLPRSLPPAYRGFFRDYVCTVSLLEQRTIAKFMEQGHWDRHVRRMRTIYKHKHDALLLAIDRHFGEEATVLGQGAGLHVVLQLSPRFGSEAQLIERARNQGINLFPFSVTAAEGEPDSSRFLLGFGGMSGDELEQAVALLFKTWSR